MLVEANDSTSNAQDVPFVYMGQGSVVPRDVTRVHLHPSVRVIVTKAFKGCTRLVEVELYERLKKVVDGTFTLSETRAVTSNAQGVFVYMGQGSVAPRYVTCVCVHHSITVISARAFEGCTRLVVMELCKGLKEIGYQAFHRCKSLKQMTIPTSVRRIGSSAFVGCFELVELELCKRLVEIGYQALYRCKSLKRMTIPSSVRRIGSSAFAECLELLELELCEGLEEIGHHAFCD